tara:strand:+ start:180 stop:368 length:189 start_codon:yes stop_codon:yes gene_type:complete
MTVQQLIEKLQTLDPNAEVIIEENHGEYYPIRDDRFYEERITEDYYHATEEDEGETMVVIRA